MNIKERRTKLLFAIFLLSNVENKEDSLTFSDAKLSGEAERAFDMPLNAKTKETLSELVKGGYIEEPLNDELSVYRLTENGFKDLLLEFPYFRFLFSPWDGKWRVLSYEIPEEKRDLRDRLRREVAGWGLGPWHRSFWLTPHPIINNLRLLIKGKEEEKYVQAFEASHEVGDTEVLIEKVWGKSALDKKYRELFKKWHDILSSEEDKAMKFRKIAQEYLTVIRQDPGLPKELIGQKWIGLEAYTIFKEVRSILIP